MRNLACHCGGILYGDGNSHAPDCPAVSPQEDAAPPKPECVFVVFEGTHDGDSVVGSFWRESEAQAETERLRAIGKPDDSCCCSCSYHWEAIQLPVWPLLAVPEGRLRELVEKWRAVGKGYAGFHLTPQARILSQCADDLDALLASVSHDLKTKNETLTRVDVHEDSGTA